MPTDTSDTRSARDLLRVRSVSFLLLAFAICGRSLVAPAVGQTPPPCYDSIGVYQSPLEFTAYLAGAPAGIPDGAFYSPSGSQAFVAPTYPAGATNFTIRYSDVGTHDQNIKFYNNNPGGIRMVFKTKLYYLIEFHFHAPAEHRFVGANGRVFQMEMHMVFRDTPNPASTNPGVVIGVPILVGKPTAPAFNDSLVRALNNGSLINGQVVAVPDSLFTSCLNYANVANFPPSIIYPGSLTTPTYTEGYTWIVVNGFVVQPAVIFEGTLGIFSRLSIGGEPIGASRGPQAPWSRPMVYYDPPRK